ncbi:hypothetical protein HPP92_012222 [Vanilla planifolia]|uniref:LOB domain-containing protein n=1 Tax=Vanilla planifolia TaxID=51239 RepID=A0A835R5Q1_VANPL|nr:hypothetical protein HPP92_012222 [Vanilla planifolia]
MCSGRRYVIPNKGKNMDRPQNKAAGNASCGACKFLRRKCGEICIFAPHFSYQQAAAHFSAIHKVFGASNVSKLLAHLPEHHRSAAALTVAYEAVARVRNPVYGCVAQVIALQQQVVSLQEEVESTVAQLLCKASNVATVRGSAGADPQHCMQNVTDRPESCSGSSSNVRDLQLTFREALESLERCLFSEEDQTAMISSPGSEESPWQMHQDHFYSSRGK